MTNQGIQITGRRSVLGSCKQVARSTNPGLWFDKFYKRDATQEEAENKKDLIIQTVGLGISPAYKNFYAGWEEVLKQQTQVFAVGEVQGRMVVGTGNKGVAEAGMTLHRTYGVPFIPGSALKGLAATYASQYVVGFAATQGSAPQNLAEYTPYQVLFGTPNSAAYLTFFDALFIPDSATQPLALDVVTGHHGDYYVGNNPKPPADWDSPIPAPFLTARGRYFIAIGGEEAWAKVALEILGYALRDLGIGAKTAAGYGRMRLLSETETTLGQVPARPAKTLQSGQGKSTQAPPFNPTEFPPDKQFTGIVIERFEDKIHIALPGVDTTVAIGVIPVTPDLPSWQQGNKARVKVVQHKQIEKGLVVVEVRRAPKRK